MAGDNFVGWSPIAGKTSISIVVRLISSAGAGVTGKLATNLTAYYYLQNGSASVSITLSDLANLNSAYSSGGVKEIDATHMPGLYRFDVPNAMIATGQDWSVLGVTCSGAIDYELFVPLSDAIPGVAAGATGGLPLIGTGANNFKSDSSANVTFANTSIATVTNVTNDVGITQAGADKVWGTISRTLTAFSFTVSITLSAANILAIWNQLKTDAGIIANSFGALLRDNIPFSGVTIQQIVDGVWNEPNADHLDSGSTGANLSLAASPAGTGFYTVEIPCEVSGIPASGVAVQVSTDIAGTIIRAKATSDTNGIATVYLDAGTYYAFLARGGDTFPNPTLITVP